MKKIFLFIFALTILVGCGSSDAIDSDSKLPTRIHQRNWSSVGYDTDVKSITVDGTDCIIVVGRHYSTSLSCDWKSNEQVSQTR